MTFSPIKTAIAAGALAITAGCSAAPEFLGDLGAAFERPPEQTTEKTAAIARSTEPAAAAEAAPSNPAAKAAAAASRPEMRAAAAAAGPSTALALSYPEPEACRTVRLYKRPRIRIAKTLPEEWRAFAGHWGDGRWNGKLCQELVIDSIDAEGNVTLYDMQGYYTPWKRVPTAFRRTGKFLPDGRLRVDLGKMGVAVYELRGDTLYGVYDWGASSARIAMVRKKRTR